MNLRRLIAMAVCLTLLVNEGAQAASLPGSVTTQQRGASLCQTPFGDFITQALATPAVYDQGPLPNSERARIGFTELAAAARIDRRPKGQRAFELSAEELRHWMYADVETIPAALKALEPSLDDLRDRLRKDGYRDGPFSYEMVAKALPIIMNREKAITSERRKQIIIILYQAFLMDYLSLLAMRIFDGGRLYESANQETVRRLFDELGSSKMPYPIRMVEHESQIYIFGGSFLSRNEKSQVDRTRRLIRLFINGDPNVYSRRAIQDEGRHLGGLIAGTENISRTRLINSVDYPKIILHLIALMPSYIRLGNQDGLALDIAAGLRSDIRAFTHLEELLSIRHGKKTNVRIVPRGYTVPGVFFPSHLSKIILKNFYTQLWSIRQDLAADLRRLNAKQREGLAAMFGRRDVYPSVLLAQMWLARILSPQISNSFVYEDINKPDGGQAWIAWMHALDDAGELILASEGEDSEFQVYIHPWNPKLGIETVDRLINGLEQMPKLPRKMVQWNILFTTRRSA